MSAIKLFCDVIQNGMELEDDQVYLWDQKIDIPNDHRLYIAVAVISCKPFANSRKIVDNGSQLQEQQSLNVQATLGIDIFSKGPEARDRKEEVILALKSTFSQQIQEKYGFYIATIPTAFVNLSEIDGAAIPYRFNISVAIQYTSIKTKTISFYDKFADTIVTEP